MAVIKANAYGHGICHVAKHSEFADAFAVARIEEALKLRASNVLKPILLLEGFNSPSDLQVLVTQNIQIVVHCEEQLLALEQAKLNMPIVVWLKIDSGMHRLGIHPNQYGDFITRLKACSNIAQPLYYMSHFSCADELDRSVTQNQLKLFLSLTHDCDGELSIAASAGLLAWKESYLDWVRPGLIMYGLSPFANSTGVDLGYRPVMTLKSLLISIRDIKTGDNVGYGEVWSSECYTKIGVVAIGYGDGYPRMTPAGTPVLLNGREVPIVGRVSMDMLTIDLGFSATDKVGDEVILWGQQLPVEKIARYIGTTAYELVSKLTSRVSMEYFK
ncbi:alanine racemase [Candidatus Photodesmus blepharus]|uniref:Alanine racemase n=2 Tax=Candidatus Photodesmus blepharonis TaxID=1179155 RepID=A0A084CMD6_9GAMM|nr:alanine racemase [Candidatus Photodesmus blepharus]